MGREHGRGTIGSQWIGCTRRAKAKSVVVTVKGMQRCREPFEKHFEKKKPEARQLPSHSEAGRGYGRGSRPVKPRSAKSAERLPAPLRSGALTGRAHARKGPPAMFGMSLSASAGHPFQRGSPYPAKNLLASVQPNRTAFSLSAFREKHAQDAASSFLTRFDLVPLYYCRSLPGK